MAAATLRMGSIFGAVAILNYDDVTLLSTGITFDTSQLFGDLQVSLDVVASGQHQNVTAGKGFNASLVFTPPILLVKVTIKGVQVIRLSNAQFTMQGIPP